MNDNQKDEDMRALFFLLNLTVTKKDVIMDRKNELKRICLQKGINNPIIGDEHYDPNKFDYSRIPQSFAHKIGTKCNQDRKVYYEYKANGRKIMETAAKYTSEQIEAK